MAKVALITALVVLFAAIALTTAKPYNGAGTGDDICGVTHNELLECKPAVAAGTDVAVPPSKACCAAVKHADLPCLCTYKPYLPLLGINATRAMQLPTTCDPTKTFHC